MIKLTKKTSADVKKILSNPVPRKTKKIKKITAPKETKLGWLIYVLFHLTILCAIYGFLTLWKGDLIFFLWRELDISLCPPGFDVNGWLCNYSDYFFYSSAYMSIRLSLLFSFLFSFSVESHLQRLNVSSVSLFYAKKTTWAWLILLMFLLVCFYEFVTLDVLGCFFICSLIPVIWMFSLLMYYKKKLSFKHLFFKSFCGFFIFLILFCGYVYNIFDSTPVFTPGAFDGGCFLDKQE